MRGGGSQHFTERKGLIEPSRTEGRSRRYSDRDIALLQRIQELTNEGVSLAGVRKVLDLEADLARLRERVEELEQELARSSEELGQAVDRGAPLVPARSGACARAVGRAPAPALMLPGSGWGSTNSCFRCVKIGLEGCCGLSARVLTAPAS